tara:strand:+ start:1021 stop:1242 length:222 start_codon:yes stop_codon:yes gene_type:complete
MSNLKNMIEFFDNYDFKNNELELNHFTKITNLKNFVNTQISYLKANSGKKLFLPYFDRLNEVYKKLKYEHSKK